MNPGFWHNNFYPEVYWQEDFWQDFGDVGLTFLNIISDIDVLPNHLTDVSDSLLIKGGLEVQSPSFLGNGSNYISISEAGDLKHRGSSKNLNLIWNIDTKINDYTITDEDVVLELDGSSNTVTITLPTAVGVKGRVYYIKSIDTTFVTDVDTTGAEKIDNDSSLALALYQSITVISNGTNWSII